MITEPQKLLVTGNSIFLYGYIGATSADNEANTSENRDIDFVVQLENLCKIHPSVNVRINSGGGSVRHGAAMIAGIQRHADKVSCYNDGMAASIAADIWMAAKNRYMAENATLMVHAPSVGAYGTAQEMRDAATMLDKLAEGSIKIMAEATGKTCQEINATYYDYKDHFFTAKECLDLGLLTQAANYKTEASPSPKGEFGVDTQKYFQEVQTLMVAQLEQITKQIIFKQINKDTDMEFSELVKKMAAGELSEADIKALDDAKKQAEEAKKASKTYSLAEMEAEVNKRLDAEKKATDDKMTQLQAQMEALLKQSPNPAPQVPGLGTRDTNEPPVGQQAPLDEATKALMEVNNRISRGEAY